MKTKAPPGKPGGVFLFFEMCETRRGTTKSCSRCNPYQGYENEGTSRETGGCFSFFSDVRNATGTTMSSSRCNPRRGYENEDASRETGGCFSFFFQKCETRQEQQCQAHDAVPAGVMKTKTPPGKPDNKPSGNVCSNDSTAPTFTQSRILWMHQSVLCTMASSLRRRWNS
ncbi:MAG: hypothetical protein RL169_1522 [Armatimonadota bacterium]